MSESARETMEKSRIEVIECEDEIKSIKKALRALIAGGGDPSTSSSSSSNDNNRLEVSVLRVVVAGGADDDAVTTPTSYAIHLSSPIESRTLTKLYDPLDPTSTDGLAVFTSLEASNALLTVEAYVDANNNVDDDDGSGITTRTLLGASAPHDLQPLCHDSELWRNGGERKVSSLDVAIVSSSAEGGGGGTSSSSSFTASAPPESPTMTTEIAAETNESSSESWEDAAAEEENSAVGRDEEGGAAGGGDDDEMKEEEAKDAVVGTKTATTTAPPPLLLPSCTLTLQLTYFPSAEERRDALYDRLNEVSKRKVAAVESLRRSAGVVNRAARAAAESESSGKQGAEPAVKSGFLNKSSNKSVPPSYGGDNNKKSHTTTPPFWKRWYDKTLGPNSILWAVGPVATNYVLFACASLFLHYKGDLLALPPPV